MKYWVGKNRKILVDNVDLEVCLSKGAYDMIFEVKYISPHLDDLEYIPVDQSTSFIKDNVVGNITKDELDT